MFDNNYCVMFRIMLFAKHVAKVHGQIILTISTRLLLIRVLLWFVLHCVFVSVIGPVCYFQCHIFRDTSRPAKSYASRMSLAHFRLTHAFPPAEILSHTFYFISVTR